MLVTFSKTEMFSEGFVIDVKGRCCTWLDTCSLSCVVYVQDLIDKKVSEAFIQP